MTNKECRVCGRKDCGEHCRCFSMISRGHVEWCPVHDKTDLDSTTLPVRDADRAMITARRMGA